MYKEVDFFLSYLISFHLKVIGKCQLQEALQEKGKGLEAIGKVSIL